MTDDDGGCSLSLSNLWPEHRKSYKVDDTQAHAYVPSNIRTQHDARIRRKDTNNHFGLFHGALCAAQYTSSPSLAHPPLCMYVCMPYYIMLSVSDPNDIVCVRLLLRHFSIVLLGGGMPPLTSNPV